MSPPPAIWRSIEVVTASGARKSVLYDASLSVTEAQVRRPYTMTG